MTPEQREELKQSALKATPGPWDFDTAETPYNIAGGEVVGGDALPWGAVYTTAEYETPDGTESLVVASEIGCDNGRFVARANPSAILSLIAQVEALTRKNLELQRVYDERGLQVERLEMAFQRAKVDALNVQQESVVTIEKYGKVTITSERILLDHFSVDFGGQPYSHEAWIPLVRDWVTKRFEKILAEYAEDRKKLRNTYIDTENAEPFVDTDYNLSVGCRSFSVFDMPSNGRLKFTEGEADGFRNMISAAPTIPAIPGTKEGA